MAVKRSDFCALVDYDILRFGGFKPLKILFKIAHQTARIVRWFYNFLEYQCTLLAPKKTKWIILVKHIADQLRHFQLSVQAAILLIDHTNSAPILQRWSTGEMSKYVPFLHSEASHPLPLYLIGAFFALNWSWHYELHEDVLGFMWVALCANWQGWKPTVTTKTLRRWLCMGKQHMLAYIPK